VGGRRASYRRQICRRSSIRGVWRLSQICTLPSLFFTHVSVSNGSDDDDDDDGEGVR